MQSLKQLGKALWWTLREQRGDRTASRLAQYHRAKLLPEWAVRSWSNASAGAHATPEVSVIITCYNYAHLVRDAIASVLPAAGETLSVEILLVDDASTDGSLDVVCSLLGQLPVPMRVLRPWWNVGVSRARNLGVGRAAGEFVFILDADNQIAAGALARLCARARSEGAAAAYGPVRKVLADGTEVGLVSDRPFDWPFLVNQNNYIDAMALFRRSSLQAIGGYDIELLPVVGGLEDYAVWLEFGARGFKVAFDPAGTGNYLVRPDSMLKRITGKEFRQAKRMFRARYSEGGQRRRAA